MSKQGDGPDSVDQTAARGRTDSPATSESQASEAEALPALIVTRHKALGLQVCTTLTDLAEIAHAANRAVLCGTELGWVVSARPECAPIRCEKFPDRMHYILDC